MPLFIFVACLAHPVGGAPSETEAAPAEPSASDELRFVGGTVVGVGQVDLLVRAGVIVGVGPTAVSATATVIDVAGRWLVPSFIDSHVHLAYLPAEEELADNGIAGVVDLAAPLAFLTTPHASLQVLASGPMVTAEGGYPTRSWGSGGYGLECADEGAAVDAVSSLIRAGAGVIKLPVTDHPQLDAPALAAAAARAHSLNVRVVSHALEDDEAARAATAGVDVLAHTPTGELSPATLAAWQNGAVISTLAAFGGGEQTVGNLRALRAAGAEVLYGTDFGNRRTAGIDASELALLQHAGLTPAEILHAGTRAPADYWGFGTLGALEVGRDASLLVLDRDPLLDPFVVADPDEVWLRGQRRR